MNRPFFVVVSVFLVFLSVQFAAAQEEDSEIITVPEKKKTSESMKLGSILVQGKKDYMLSSEVAGPVDVVGEETIEKDTTGHSMEVMKKVPGVYYGHWNQGAVTGTISIRGFDFDHDPTLKLLIDGVPHNRAGGPMDIHPVFPMEIERMELVKGTTDVRYGLHNVAGTLNVITHRGGDITKAKLLYGSYNTVEADTLVARKKNGFSQTYFVGFRQSDGYRDHSSYRKGAGSGKWFYTSPDSRLQTGVILRAFGMQGDTPGYLNEEEADENPTKSNDYNSTDGSRQTNQDASYHFQYMFNDNLFFSLVSYARRFERTRWVRFAEAWGQTERLWKESHYGSIANLVYDRQFNSFVLNNLKLSLGGDYQFQDNIFVRYNTTNRERDSLGYGWDYTQHNGGGFVQADVNTIKIVRLIAGVRADRFDGKFKSKNTGETRDMEDFGTIWQPKVGMVITPVEGYSLYANWGRTFQMPSESNKFGVENDGTVADGDMSYSENDGWEVGTRLQPVSFVAVRLSYWEMVRSKELKPTVSGEYETIGKTTRKGWELAVNVTPVKWLNVWGSYARQTAEYTDPGPTNQSIEGNDIAIIPEYSAKYGADLETPLGITLSAWGEVQGKYYADADNTVKVDSYHLFNGAVMYNLNKNTMIQLQVHNIFDQDYIAFAWDTFQYGETDAFSPGDGRSVFLSLTTTL